MRETSNNVLTALSEWFLIMYLEFQDDSPIEIDDDDTQFYSPWVLGEYWGRKSERAISNGAFQ